MGFVPRSWHHMFSPLVLSSLLLNLCYCLNLKLTPVSIIQNEGQWSMGEATWYGSPNGAGSDGGACGYGGYVENPPLSKFVSAGGPSLFNFGKGCGACYEVKCTGNAACSGMPVMVTITDSCPSCTSKLVHFDLSGTAFGAMAKTGQANALRNAGVLQVQYRRVACRYGMSIAFLVDKGSNPYYFSFVIEYENGDGDVIAVELRQALESSAWVPMHRSWGANWSLNLGLPLRAPFSIKVIEAGNRTTKTIVANNVIPAGWRPGQLYRSVVNFPPST